MVSGVTSDPLGGGRPGRMPITRRATSRANATSISSLFVLRPKYPAMSAFGPKRWRCGCHLAFRYDHPAP